MPRSTAADATLMPAAARPLSLIDGGAALAVIIIWAFNFIAAKIGVGQVPALLLLALRFGLVALLLAPFLSWPGRKWRLIVLLSFVLGTLHFGCLFSGIAGMSAGPAAIALQLTVPFSAILAFVFYRERTGPAQVLGMVIAFVGVYVLKGEPASVPSLGPLALVITGAFSWALGNIIIKRIGPINGFTLNAWVALLVAPQFLLGSAIFETGQIEALRVADWRVWSALAYMAVAASIIAYGLWYYLLAKYDVNKVVPLTLLAPVIAVVLAVVVLGEPLTKTILIGGLITLAGVAIIQFTGPRPPVSPEPS